MRIAYGFSTEGTGEKLTPFPGSPGSGQAVDTDDQEAAEVPYDNTGSGLSATNVQQAIDELIAQLAFAQQISEGDLLSTGEVGTSSDFTLISHQAPTGTGVVTFSSIPSTFKHLLLIGTGRSTAGASPDVNIQLTFNNDTGGNYDSTQHQMQNATQQSNTQAAATSLILGHVPWSGATANNNGSFEFFILNYTDTSLFKSGSGRSTTIGATAAGVSFIARHGGFLWRSTNAINRIDLTLAAGNWAAGSGISLYGIS